MSSIQLVECRIQAEEPGAEGNLASGTPLNFAVAYDLDFSNEPGEAAVGTRGYALGPISGGRDGTAGEVPVGSVLKVRDQREDVFAIAGAAADAYTPLWSRVPVRGPVQVELALATTCTGYVEDDAPDIVHRILPLLPRRGDAPSPISSLRVVTGDEHVHLGDVPEGVQEVSLFVHAPSATSHVVLGYVPDAERVPFTTLRAGWQPYSVATIDVPGGLGGFVAVLDRIPVRGPGSLWAHVAAGGDQVVLYGLLSD